MKFSITSAHYISTTLLCIPAPLPGSVLRLVLVTHAMARLSFRDGDNNVVIVLNSDLTPSFQRFALILQIGRLLILLSDAELDPDSYVVSTRISYELTNISPEDMERDRYLLREQVSNVFALRVLMPGDQFFRKIRELDSVEGIARF